MNTRKQKLVAFGECMVELRRVEEGLMRQAFGGDTLNTAVYLARLAGGAFDVAYASALGDSDSFSDAMLASWAAEGIDTGFVERRAGELPGLYTIEVDAAGERRFAYWRQHSAARNYFASDASPLERRAAEIDLLYLSGISLAILPQAGRDRLFALIDWLRAKGARFVFDNNYRPRLWSSADEARQTYAAAYARADIALVTLSDEMDVQSIADEAQAIEFACALPCREVVIKRGASPTLVRAIDGSRTEVATEPVPTVVDTTAAGDSFGAGYLAARLHGLGAAQAAAVGNRLAAAVIQCPGAIIPRERMPAALLA